MAQAPGAPGVASVSVEGTKTTYSAAIVGLVPAASCTDFYTIKGSASKTVRVTRLEVSGNATGAAAADLQLIVRSTADTGGTSTTPTAVPHDSASAAATAVVNAYTANPTTGTTVGTVRAQKLTLPAAPGAPVPIIWDFSIRNEQALVLRGVAQQLCLNLNAGTYAGNSFDVSLAWTEE